MKVIMQKVGPLYEDQDEIVIDDFDIWSMDYTLAKIIHPMLVRLKERKHGGPFTDDEDVPDDLKRVNSPPVKEWYTDENFWKRWDWIMDEMIWTFDQLQNYDDHFELQYNDEWNARIDNGLRLFGKYYRALWD